VYSLITLSLSSFLPPELAVVVFVVVGGLSALCPASKSYTHQDLCHTPGHESLSLCPDSLSLFLLPMEGLGGLPGKTNSSYRATQFN